MKKISLIFFFMCFFLMQINAKKTLDPRFVHVVEVVNPELVLILDSIVEHEKRCEYYELDLVFTILFWKIDNEPVMLIGSPGTRVANYDDVTGCFYFKNHVFIVCDKLPKYLFKKTSQRLLYSFAVNQSGKDPITGEIFIDSMGAQDDSYSYWTYSYENNKLIFLERSTFCK